MITLLLKNVPDSLKARLEKSAMTHHLSVNQEAIQLLPDALDSTPALPNAKKIRLPFDNKFVGRAKRLGRA